MSIDEIIAKHRSDERFVCYAETLGKVKVAHGHLGKDIREITLICTERLGHEGDHKDGVHCWTPHRFPVAMATEPNPGRYNWEHCVECGKEWPCDVALIGQQMAESEPVVHVPSHRQVGVVGTIDGVPQAAVVDEGLYDAITALWRAGIRTAYSCQGGEPHHHNDPTYYEVSIRGYIMLPDGHQVAEALKVLGWDMPGQVILDRWPSEEHPDAICIRFYDALDMRFHLSPDEPSALEVS